MTGKGLRMIYASLGVSEMPVSLMAGAVLQKIANEAAFAERGYASLGGEFFVFPFAFLATVFAFELILKAVKTEYTSRRKQRNIRIQEKQRYGQKGKALPVQRENANC